VRVGGWGEEMPISIVGEGRLFDGLSFWGEEFEGSTRGSVRGKELWCSTWSTNSRM
jgi:hypothetical protein